MQDTAEVTQESNFQLTLSANDQQVWVQVMIPHEAPQTTRQVIFELLTVAFAAVESVPSLVIRRGMLSGIDELLAREDVLVLQRHYVGRDYPERLHAALSICSPMSLTLH